jgi:hypothetical protein
VVGRETLAGRPTSIITKLEELKMSTWTRSNYNVVEVEFNYDLHQFEVVQDGTVLHTITPADLDSQADIISDLNNGECVNGWEDGMGNSIYI